MVTTDEQIRTTLKGEFQGRDMDYAARVDKIKRENFRTQTASK